MAMTVEEAMGMSEDEAEGEDDGADEDKDSDADGDADSDEEMQDATGEKDTPTEPVEPATPDAPAGQWGAEQGGKGHDAIAVVDQGEPMVVQ